jgi:hypothetical protein
LLQRGNLIGLLLFFNPVLDLVIFLVFQSGLLLL